MAFGQLVVGPPGSGKSTYCHGMQQFLLSLGRRPVLVNLDPANENIPYQCDVNITDFITVDRIMAEQGLGPNGSLLYCIEELERNIEWLTERLEAFEDGHFILDLPGQVEVSTCHPSLLNIIKSLTRRNFRLVVVHLSDAAYCADPMKYVSMLIVTIKSMMQLECPQINVLSKIDLVESYGALPLRIDFYTDVKDLRYLLAGLDEDYIGKKYQRLNSALCELVEELNLVSFVPLAIEDKDCMEFLLAEIDKANGWVFGGLVAGNESIMEVAATEAKRENLIELIKERYTSNQSHGSCESGQSVESEL